MPDSDPRGSSRSRLLPRAAAYVIDSTLAFVVVAASQLWGLAPIRTALGMENAWFHSGWNTQVYTLLTISIPVWLYFAWFESSPSGATLGKRPLGLQVVDAAGGRRIPFSRALSRALLKLLPWELAHVANNLPQPLWYTDEPGFRIAFVLSGLALAANFALVCWDGRGYHDRAARTRVTGIR